MASHRAFVLRHTRLRAVPGVGGIRLHLSDEVLQLWRALQVETGDADAALPYWAFAWGGGLAIASFLEERADRVAGRRVLDIGTGSGLCAIAAARAGAAEVAAVDIDPFAIEAARLNARANRATVEVARADVLDEPPPDVDVIMAGDCWYESLLAERVTRWLVAAVRRGIDVLIGDPGRRYLPEARLEELAAYQVRTTTELEDLELKTGRVFAIRVG